MLARKFLAGLYGPQSASPPWETVWLIDANFKTGVRRQLLQHGFDQRQLEAIFGIERGTGVYQRSLIESDRNELINGGKDWAGCKRWAKVCG